jgi:hypothetical protein
LTNVADFQSARAALFRSELRSINAEFRTKLAGIRTWPVDWWEDDSCNPVMARNWAMADATNFILIKRLERCLAAARRYGADTKPFENALKRWRPDVAA